MADRFAGQVAVVTGAAAGFGLAVAGRLAAEGARLVLVDRAADPLTEAAIAIPSAVPVVADVSQEADVESYVQTAVTEHGRIDLFFNNAGIEGRLAPMTELAVEDFDRLLAVNCRGVFLGLRAVLRVMKEQNSGAIVNTASMAGIRGSATFAPYIASKHAVVGLTRSAALEGAPFGIRVNAVAPGHIDTRMGAILRRRSTPMTRTACSARPPPGSPSATATAPPRRWRAWWSGCCRTRRRTCPAPPTSSTALSTRNRPPRPRVGRP